MTRNSKFLLLFILILSFLLRLYNFKSYYVFSHDQDLASWIVKDIVENGHLRLIGQETSSQGIFIGALFYYLQIPFYLISSMNPLGAVFLPIILGLFATYSIFFVFSKLTNSKVGLIGSFIYAVSALIVFVDREVAPTMPVMLWTIWYLYSLFLIYKSDYMKGFILAGLLFGLVWHLNLALILLTPLVPITFLFSKRVFDIKAILLGLGVLFIISSPFILFEVRHNFNQTKSIYLSLTTTKDLRIKDTGKLAKLDRVMQLVNKNSIGIFSKSNFVKPSFVTFGLLILLIYLIRHKKINKFLGAVSAVWLGLYVVFFTFNALNPSEYYFNGMNIIWILIASVALSHVRRSVLIFLMILFILSNLNFLFKYNTDKKGYIEKMELVTEIKNDSQLHGYPCVSVSYITSPGYDLGYRYLFYIQNMHVNLPKSNSPVYTIVYPHSLVDRIDKSFGSLGLIYPEYEKYNEKDIMVSCSGENSNLTEPMFGYTE